MDVAALRAETPGCERLVHLNNAGAALMPSPVVAAIREYLDFEGEVGGYEAETLRSAEVTRAYEAIAALVSAAPRNIAFTSSATASFVQALSSIPFATGDTVLVTRHDYVSHQVSLLALRERFGIRVVRAPDQEAGGVDVAAMAALIEQHRPRLVCLTHIPTNSGLVQDAAGVGAACRAHGVLYLVDGCQTVGQMPVNVAALQCDFLTSTARKFLRGPRGLGFLVVSDRALAAGLVPLSLDMRGADWVGPDEIALVDDARRFEQYEYPWALVMGMAEAARYAMRLGLGPIQQRVRSLASLLRTELARVQGVRVLDHGAELSGIVTAWVEGHEPIQVVEALRQQRINTWAQGRGAAVLDYDAKGVAGAVRISPHAYNTEEEIGVVTGAIRGLCAGSGAPVISRSHA